jgi:hypothetical protein
VVSVAPANERGSLCGLDMVYVLVVPLHLILCLALLISLVFEYRNFYLFQFQILFGFTHVRSAFVSTLLSRPACEWVLEFIWLYTCKACICFNVLSQACL